jgi:flagellin-like hook-associated protein FlgL
MASNLVNLMSVNDDIATSQTRLATGKKVSSALDDAAVYFKARTLSERSDAYDLVNANITAGLKNVEVANKALDTMYSNLNGLLTQVKDAASKSIAATNNVNTTGGTAYGSATASLVGAGLTADLADSSIFQNGDRFSMTYRQQDGTQVTRYFQATSTAGAATLNNAGTTAGTAITFNTATELQQAVRNAFGNSDVVLNVNATGQLNLATTAAGTTLTIAQLADAGTAGAGNAKLDFSRVFGTSGSTTYNGGTGQNDPAGNAITGTGVTYTGTGNAASAANLESRRQAADTYRATLLQLANLAKDAYMPGSTNLLTGNTMTIDLNADPGDVQQKVSIGGAVDPATLSFGGFNANTGDDSQSTANFNADVNINNAITRITNAMATLRIRQNALSTHSTMLTTRLDFNKSFQTTMKASVTELTAADTAEEAAKMAAAQNQQSFASNNLSVTKQAEQSLLQLLR